MGTEWHRNEFFFILAGLISRIRRFEKRNKRDSEASEGQLKQQRGEEKKNNFEDVFHRQRRLFKIHSQKTRGEPEL